MSSLDHAIETIQRSGQPIVIFGAGVVGEVILSACTAQGLSVACFCDNNINKTKSLFCDTRVVHTSALKSEYSQANIIISAADIHDVIKQLAELELATWFPGSIFLKNVNVYENTYSAPADFVDYAVNTCILSQNGYLETDKLYLRSVDIIITERCSLKCADCSNLMQYYEKPQNCVTEDVIESIQNFCKYVDEVNEFRVIGGEPFVNKDIHIITKTLIDETKVKNIVIYTNGTISPKDSQIEYLKHEKVLVLITDYGHLSKNLDKLIRTLQDNGIRYYVDQAGGWTDCSAISKHNRTEAGKRQIFTECCAKNTFTLSDSKFYRCPFAANMGRLNIVPEEKADFIDLSDPTIRARSVSVVKKQIKAYITELDYLSVCDHCNGRSFDAPEIEPAIQLKKYLQLDITQLHVSNKYE